MQLAAEDPRAVPLVGALAELLRLALSLQRSGLAQAEKSPLQRVGELSAARQCRRNARRGLRRSTQRRADANTTERPGDS